MLAISYQNFSSIEPSEQDSLNTLKIIDEMNHFQKGTTENPALAVPAGGHDLKSVSNDWAQRQTSLWLNGYDKKLESALTAKLNSWTESLLNSKEDAAESPTAQETAEAPGELQKPALGDSHKVRPSLRFARLNSLKYDLGGSSSLDLTADPGNTRFNYTQALSQRTRFGLEHKTAGRQTQMFLKYDW